MKTPLLPPNRLVALSLVLLSAPALRPAPSDPLPESHYTLFVGLDVQVPFGESYYPLRGVYNKQRGVEIRVQDESHRVLLDKISDLRMKRDLKVSGAPAQIDNLKTDRAYSPLSDPMRNWMRTQITMSSQVQMIQQEAAGKVLQEATKVVYPGAYPAPNSPTGDPAMDQMQRMENAISGMNEASISLLSDPVGAVERMGNESGKELYDAIEVSFDVSAPEHIAEAYVVMLANYTVPQRPETFRFIYAQAIGPVSPEARRITLWSSGLPPGFEVVDTSLYLYSYGEEIPTNLSDKAVAVTEEQAMRLLQAQHVKAHRGETVPAQPLWQTAPANFRARLDLNELPAAAKLEVDAEGRVVRVLGPGDEPLRLRGLQADLFLRTRYLPALNEGTPVASVLEIEPRRYFQ